MCLDVVIEDHYFELEFEVERIGLDENGEENVVDWNGGGEGEGEGRGMEHWMVTRSGIPSVPEGRGNLSRRCKGARLQHHRRC